MQDRAQQPVLDGGLNAAAERLILAALVVPVAVDADLAGQGVKATSSAHELDVRRIQVWMRSRMVVRSSSTQSRIIRRPLEETVMAWKRPGG
ncbi:hypothetical protein IU459_23200 [Nocardia amamiensis]|uniref:DUF222 domain-containing protein n=1 Tax=Nocardia amamiensis TaxID=404578 RepID=A0ABS0CUZ4_9NOCA|nr:hypothetical protein [Nocardia amamiensis]MBF6300429.1 hypothetical protein [Nocardia amamiensis]